MSNCVFLYTLIYICFCRRNCRNVYFSRNWRKFVIKQSVDCMANMDDYKGDLWEYTRPLNLSICIETLYFAVFVPESSILRWLPWNPTLFFTGLTILIPRTVASPILRQSDLETETKDFMSLFKRTEKKKCRHHFCLDLCLDLSCRRTSDWIKENRLPATEREIDRCLYTCARETLLSIIARKSNLSKGRVYFDRQLALWQTCRNGNARRPIRKLPVENVLLPFYYTSYVFQEKYDLLVNTKLLDY